MEQENPANEGNNDELFDKLVFEIGDRALDQAGTVVGRDDFHARRQTRFQLLQLGLHRVDGFQRIFTRAHHNYATGDFAFTVQFRNPAPHFGAYLNARDIGQTYRYPGVGRHQWNLAEVVERFQITRRAHHVFGFPEFQYRSAGFLIRLFHRVDHLAMRDVVSAHLVRVEHDLILAHHAADAGDFRYVWHGFQFVLEKPVLQRTQLRQVHLATTV